MHYSLQRLWFLVTICLSVLCLCSSQPVSKSIGDSSPKTSQFPSRDFQPPLLTTKPKQFSNRTVHLQRRPIVNIANVSIACNQYPELYRLVKSPGTRSLLYIISSTNDSQRIADEYVSCHGNWVKKVVLPKSVYFENVVYQSFLPQHRAEWTQYDYVITATYKTLTRKLLPRYMPLQTFIHMKEFLKLARKDDYDVIPFLRDFEEMMPTSVKYHQQTFKLAWDALLQELGYNQSYIEQFYTMKAFYRNVFIIKPTVLDMLIEFMNRALSVAQSNHRIQSLLQEDAHYVLGKPQIAQEIFGTSYYQLHPFIFERLPSFFLYSINAKVCTGSSGPCKYNYKG